MRPGSSAPTRAPSAPGPSKLTRRGQGTVLDWCSWVRMEEMRSFLALVGLVGLGACSCFVATTLAAAVSGKANPWDVLLAASFLDTAMASSPLLRTRSHGAHNRHSASLLRSIDHLGWPTANGYRSNKQFKFKTTIVKASPQVNVILQHFMKLQKCRCRTHNKWHL